MAMQNNENINVAELVDIQSITIDTTQPVPAKKASYRRQIGNHKLFLYDGTIVRISFMDNGPSLKDRLKQYLLSGQSAELTSA